MSSSSPIPNFLRAFSERRHDRLEPFLHDDVVYAVDGFAPVDGRRAVLGYWRRMFETHTAVRMSLERHVRDGDLVLVAQRQVYVAVRRPPLILDSMTLFELVGGRIRLWEDRPREGNFPAEDAVVWRRLRSARW